MSGEFSFEAFGRDLHRFVQWALDEAGEREESSFAKLLREHFGEDPAGFPITREPVAGYDEPNLQLGLDTYLEQPGHEHRLVGFAGADEMAPISLAALVGSESGYLHVGVGPVQRTLVELEDGRPLTCVTAGMYLVQTPTDRLALRVGRRMSHMGVGGLEVEVMAPAAETAETFIARLRGLMAECNVYHGKMLALEGGEHFESLSVRFLPRPATARSDIVLPAEVLDTIDLNTIGFSGVRERLLQAGMHLRRGLLLHGPPGTGKTLTAGYLAAALTDRTVIVLTGSALGLVSTACAMARELQPSLIVLEDIDLIAAERTMIDIGGGSLLFQLLNEIDGIGPDADVVFLMTTNRADLLEPALAARPGRVDQAVALPLPDSEGRARLLELYCRGVAVALSDRETVIERTDGASSAFMRELVRKAAVHAAIEDEDVVTDAHFGAALDGLERGGSLTRRILGAEGAEDVEPPGDFDGGWYDVEP